MHPDPQTQALLDGMAASSAPPLYELSVDAARAALKTMTLSMDAPRAGNVRGEDRSIEGPAGPVSVRIYYPVNTAKDASTPLLLFFHGGGFALGDLDTHDNVVRHLSAGAGMIAVSVDYRLAPEHKFPTGVEDCYAALCWVAAHAQELGADPGRIAVAGDSAGGNLAAVMCLLARDRRGPMPAFQVLIYPVVDLTGEASYPSRESLSGGEYFLSRGDFAWINGMYFTDQAVEGRDLRASPILAGDPAGLPPALIITAGFDPLRDEGAAYAQVLRDAGVPVEYRCFESTIHGFLSFSGALDAGREGLELIEASLRRRLAT